MKRFIHDISTRHIISANASFYLMVVLLITVAISPTINSVLGSPSTTINNSSSYPLSNVSSSTPSTAQKENKNLTSTFEITDQIKALIDDRLDKK